MQRRRTTTACARCHNRKRKCDKKFPRCSSCREAGVECKGLSRDANIDAPRSVVQYLEHAISQAEAQLASSGISPGSLQTLLERPKLEQNEYESKVPLQSPPLRNPTVSSKLLDANSFKFASATAVASGFGIPSPTLADLEGIPYKDALLLDTELPLPLSIDQIKSNPLPHHLHNSIPSMQHRSEPFIPALNRATALFEIYVQNILPQNPCFFEDDVRSHFNAVYYQPGTVPPDTSVFIISMVLAISTMTSKAYDQKKILSLGESLHQQALRHSNFLSQPTIRSLQGILLLLQLAELLPYTGNLWHLAGEAVSLTTELGLHQDPHESEGFDFKSLDLRRRLFWTVYCLERSTTVTSYRPFTLGDEYINTAFPCEFEDAFIKPEGLIPGGRRSKVPFLNYVRFRQLQSEILGVQFFNRELQDQEYSRWVVGMEKRLVDWQQAALANVEKGPDWFSHALWQCYIMLHRPCPRNPVPSENSIATCFDAALGLSSGSWELLKTGYLQYPFHNAHNGFEAATVILYGLRYHTMRVRDEFGSRKVIDLIHQLSSLFVFLSPRWPAAGAISDFFNGLKKITIKDFITKINWTPSPHDLYNLNANPLDLIVLHKPVDTSSSADAKQLTASQVYDESDLVLSNLLSNIHELNSPILSDMSWEAGNFWDIGGAAFVPRVANWLEMTALDTSMESIPHESIPHEILPRSTPLRHCIEVPMLQDNAVPITPGFPTLEIKFEALKNTAHLLPACNRCRTRRIKCERVSLECQQCQVSDTSCVYFDQLLSKDISSCYVTALLKRLSTLLESKNQTSLLADSSSLLVQQNSSEYEKCMGVHSRPCLTSSSPVAGDASDLTYQSTIFFGVTSAISQLANLKSCTTLSDNDFRYSSRSTCDSLQSLQKLTRQFRTALPPYSTTIALLSVFNNSFNVVCHVVSMGTLQGICTNIYSRNDCGDTFELQTLYLVLAVTLQLLSKRDHSLSDTAQTYFREVASDPGRISSLLQRNSLKSLRVAILLCAYVYLRPSSGDIWRLVGFTSRLCLGMINCPRSDTSEKDTFELLYQTLLCLDCKVSIAFGRPSQLPDYHGSIMTPPPISKSMTFTEQLSSSYHNMRRIDSAIASCVMRKYVDLGERVRKISAIFHSCGEQLDSWRIGWNALFDSLHRSGIAEELIGNPARLKQWGDLEYYRTLLLVHRLSPSASISAPERLHLLHLFLQIYRDIHYDSAAAISSFLSDPSVTFNAYLYPSFWTGAQSVLSAALDLVELREHFTGGCHAPVFRSCITLLALLEGDSTNMIDGLTQIVEKLYDGLDSPNGTGTAREMSFQRA